VVPAGTTITFGCETDSGSLIRWIFNSSQLRVPEVLFSGYSVVSTVAWRISVHTTERGNNITLKNVSSNDSGVYSCQALIKSSWKVDFHLLVTGKSFSFELISDFLVLDSLLAYSVNVNVNVKNICSRCRMSRVRIGGRTNVRPCRM